MADETPKIIIDEDWKDQVQREKEEAQKATQDNTTPKEDVPGAKQEGASFEALVSSLAMQAMFALGMIPQQDNEQVMVDLTEGKYLIDMLMILQEKTKGNLTPQEEGTIMESLANLQRVFVVRSQQVHEAALQNAGVDLGAGNSGGAPA